MDKDLYIPEKGYFFLKRLWWDDLMRKTKFVLYKRNWKLCHRKVLHLLQNKEGVGPESSKKKILQFRCSGRSGDVLKLHCTTVYRRSVPEDWKFRITKSSLRRRVWELHDRETMIDYFSEFCWGSLKICDAIAEQIWISVLKCKQTLLCECLIDTKMLIA